MIKMSTKDIVKLRKSGNSLVITISKRLLQNLNWKEGDYVLVEAKRLEEDKSPYDYAGKWILHIEKVEG